MKTNKIAAIALSGFLAFSVSACSKDEKKDKDPKADKSPSASESVDPGRVSPSDLPVPPKVRKEKGAISDLTMGECETKSGKQSIDGELKSSAKAPADFLVTVSWTTASGDVMGRGFKVFQDLGPGENVKFTIDAEVADGATQCVKGVSYGVIKG